MQKLLIPFVVSVLTLLGAAGSATAVSYDYTQYGEYDCGQQDVKVISWTRGYSYIRYAPAGHAVPSSAWETEYWNHGGYYDQQRTWTDTSHVQYKLSSEDPIGDTWFECY